MVQTVSSARAAAAAIAAAITYREQAPPPVLAPWVRRVWRLTVQGGGPGWAVARLELDQGAVRVGTLGPDLGLGERQLRRRFLAGSATEPKTLAGRSPAALLGGR